MKCIKVIVPRLLIDYYLPHPEFSGEVLLVLENGFFTDVYTDEDYNLITPTNDQDLINYLEANQGLKSNPLNLQIGSWNLRRLEFNDQDILFDWFNRKTNYSFNDEGCSKNTITEYISHALTKNSNILMIENESNKVGIIGYDVIYSEAIIHLFIYEKALIKQEEVKLILDKIMDYVKENYSVETFLSTFFTEDSYSRNLFKESGFGFEKAYDLEVYDKEFKEESLYIYDNFQNIITDSDLKFLDEFLELADDELSKDSNSDEFKDLIRNHLFARICDVMENNYYNLYDSKEEIEKNKIKDEKILSILETKFLENNKSEAKDVHEFKKVLYNVLRIIDKYSRIKEKLIKKI